MPHTRDTRKRGYANNVLTIAMLSSVQRSLACVAVTSAYSGARATKLCHACLASSTSPNVYSVSASPRESKIRAFGVTVALCLAETGQRAVVFLERQADIAAQNQIRHMGRMRAQSRVDVLQRAL